MEYKDLITGGCSLVYGGSKAERIKFESEFLAAYPEFKTETHPEFVEGKKTLFGKKLSAWEIMFKHPAVKAMGEDKVEEMSKNIFLKSILHRIPAAMSNTQKFRFSIFLNAIEGKKCFFLKDEVEGNPDDTLNTILWINENVKDAKIVWLTDVVDAAEFTLSRKGIAIPYFLKYKPTMASVSDRVIDLAEETK